MMVPPCSENQRPSTGAKTGATGRSIVRRYSIVDLTLCGKTGRETVSSATGWWGPDGKGWPDVCRECHRMEHGLKEQVR